MLNLDFSKFYKVLWKELDLIGRTDIVNVFKPQFQGCMWLFNANKALKLDI